MCRPSSICPSPRALPAGAFPPFFFRAGPSFFLAGRGRLTRLRGGARPRAAAHHVPRRFTGT